MIWRSILIGILLGGVPIAAYCWWSILMDHAEPRIHNWVYKRERSKSIQRMVGSGHYTEEEAGAIFDANWADAQERYGR